MQTYFYIVNDDYLYYYIFVLNDMEFRFIGHTRFFFKKKLFGIIFGEGENGDAINVYRLFRSEGSHFSIYFEQKESSSRLPLLSNISNFRQEIFIS